MGSLRPARLDQADLDRFLGGGDAPPPTPLSLKRAQQMVTQPLLKSASNAGGAGNSAFVVQRRVEYRDVDPEAHVNNASYASYFEDAFFMYAAFARKSGETAALSTTSLALSPAALRSCGIAYKSPAFLDDLVEVRVFDNDLRGNQPVLRFECRRPRDGAILASAYSVFAPATSRRS